MKIAYLVNQYPKVSHTFVRREIAALEELGIEVHRFSVRVTTELYNEIDIVERNKTTALLDIGYFGLLLIVAVTLLRHPRAWLKTMWQSIRLGYGSERGVLIHLAYLAEACRLARLLRQHGIDHVHAHFGTNSTTVVLLCRYLAGTTYSFTVHGPEEFDKPASISLGEKIVHAKFVVAISEFGRSQLYRWCGVEHWDKIHIVRCGLDRQFLKSSLTDVPSELRLVCIGRLCEQKGQLLLVKAAAQLKATGEAFKLVLVGDGEQRAEIEKLVEESQLEDRIEITGWTSGQRVKQELVASRALVLPSFAEGLPVVIMEAMALQRPVISTYIAGIPELVEPQQTGWLCPAGSLEALVEAMRDVLHREPDMLTKMGQAGRFRIVNQHSVTTEAKKLIKLFFDT